MIFPIRSDRRLEHTPWVNYSLVAVNTFIFLMTISPDSHIPWQHYYLDPRHPALYQFITYQFLHAGWMHLIGNMIFLYVFGNSVEDRLGKIGYLAFYLAGGVIAGLGYCMLEAAPVLGASGSIAAVTGAYLALFPLSDITIVYFFILIGTFEISSIWLILFQIGENLVMQLSSNEPVAYLAHLVGYAYGFGVGMALLGTRLLSREPYDLMTMFEHFRRRRQFSVLTRQGYQPWQSKAVAAPASAAPPDAREARLLDRRGQIHDALSTHDSAGAARLYADLLDIDPNQVLNQQAQLDLANQFMAEGKHALAAKAYELFLRTYPTYEEREQVQLILGLIYARYLRVKARAAELLNAALPRLHDAGQRELATRTLAELQV